MLSGLISSSNISIYKCALEAFFPISTKSVYTMLANRTTDVSYKKNCIVSKSATHPKAEKIKTTNGTNTAITHVVWFRPRLGTYL